MAMSAADDSGVTRRVRVQPAARSRDTVAPPLVVASTGAASRPGTRGGLSGTSAEGAFRPRITSMVVVWPAPLGPRKATAASPMGPDVSGGVDPLPPIRGAPRRRR